MKKNVLFVSWMTLQVIKLGNLLLYGAYYETNKMPSIKII